MSTEKPPCPRYKTDAELLKDFLQKLDSAYRCLIYICYNQIIPSLERKNFRFQNHIEDIVIGALTEVIQKTMVYDSVRALLWTISSRRVIDWIRKRCSQDEDGNVIVHEPGSDNWALFESLFLDSDLILHIEFEDKFRVFLDTLTPREKEVLELLYEGKTDDVIAVMLGVQVGAINNLKTRIKTRYKDFFGIDPMAGLLVA